MVLRVPALNEPVELLDGHVSPRLRLAIKPFKAGGQSAALNLEQHHVPGIVVANSVAHIVVAGLELRELEVVAARIEARPQTAG